MDLDSGLKRAVDCIQIPVVFTPIQNEKMKYKIPVEQKFCFKNIESCSWILYFYSASSFLCYSCYI